MSEQLDKLIKAVSDLQEVVKDSKPDPAVLDWDTVKAQFEDKIEALVERQIKEAQERQPVFKGNPVGAFSVEQAMPGLLKAGNRYARIVRDIGRDGVASHGTKKLKAVDLWIAQTMLDGQHVIKQQRRHMDGDHLAAPASDDLKAAIKALTSTGSGTGDELVPTDLAAQLWEDFFLASRVAGAIDTIDMPTNPFDVPLGLGDVTWRKGTENTATTASDPSTAKSTLTVTELVTEQNWSYTLEEDAVIAMAPAIRRRLGISGAEMIDDFALNADSTNAATGNINLDDADPADDSYYLSAGQDGIRHQWILDNTDQNINAGGDALADADILSALVAMGKYAVNPEQTVMVADISTYLKGLLDLDAVITIDKFGPEAVVKTGQLAAYRGIPIIVSASHPLGEADGKVSDTSGNNTLGSLSIFNTMMWYLGFRRDVLIEVDRDIQKRMYLMVTSFREAIGAHGTRSSNTHTAGIRNILV